MKHIAAINIGAQFFSSGGSGMSVFAVDSLTGIPKIVSIILKGSFALAGVILLFYFIMGGIGIMSGAGKGDPKQLEQAKSTLTTSLIGFVVVIASYWIVKLIGYIFGVPDLI